MKEMLAKSVDSHVLHFVVLKELQLHGHFARRLLWHFNPSFSVKNNALDNRSGCLTFIFADDTISASVTRTLLL